MKKVKFNFFGEAHNAMNIAMSLKQAKSCEVFTDINNPSVVTVFFDDEQEAKPLIEALNQQGLKYEEDK